MARFRLRAIEVDAEPYRLGLEDEFSQTVPVLVTPDGRLEVGPGDWIVTKGTGEREVLKAEIFQKLYEDCFPEERLQSYERVNRGIPLRSG